MKNSSSITSALSPEAALQIARTNRVCVFGPEGVDLPAQVRRRVSESLTHAPLFLQAVKLMKEQKWSEAYGILERCISEVEESDLEDPRFFGVYWQMGQALKYMSQGDGNSAHWEPVMQRLCEAIVRYPSQARSAHYVAAAELLAQHRPMTGKQDSAAILQRGMTTLLGQEGRLSDKLRVMFAESELPQTKEYRPQPISVRAGKNSRASDRSTGCVTGHQVDWVQELLEKDQLPDA